jgi:hypothetical protein
VLGTEILKLLVGVRHFVIFVMIVLPSFKSLSSTEDGCDVLLVVQSGGVDRKLSQELQLE